MHRQQHQNALDRRLRQDCEMDSKLVLAASSKINTGDESARRGARRGIRYGEARIVGRGPGQPTNTRGPTYGQDEPAARDLTSHGRRPCPAHHIFNFSPPGNYLPGTAWPGSIRFQNTRPGPCQGLHITHELVQHKGDSNDNGLLREIELPLL